MSTRILVVLSLLPILLLSWTFIVVEGRDLNAAQESEDSNNSSVVYYNISKLCPPQEVVIMTGADSNVKFQCVNDSQEFYRSGGGDFFTSKYDSKISVDYIYEEDFREWCSEGSPMVGSPNLEAKSLVLIEFFLLPSGNIIYRYSGNHRWKEISPEEVRIDHLILAKDDSTSSPLIAMCKERAHVGFYDIYHIPYEVFAPLYLGVFILYYMWTWREQNVRGWSIACFITCMFAAFILSDVHTFHRKLGIRERSSLCYANAIIYYFFTIAGYSWYTSICFDIWMVIGSNVAPSSRSKGQKRFLAYCCFSFGVPTLCLVVALSIEANFDIFDDRVIRTNFGVRKCNMEPTAEFYYETIVFLLLNFATTVMAILILKVFYEYKRDVRILDSNRINQLKLFGRLYLVMAPDWIIELFLWTLDPYHNHPCYWTIYYFYWTTTLVLQVWILAFRKEMKDLVKVTLSNSINSLRRLASNSINK